jgi:hypothetical protein
MLLSDFPLRGGMGYVVGGTETTGRALELSGPFVQAPDSSAKIARTIAISNLRKYELSTLQVRGVV